MNLEITKITGGYPYRSVPVPVGLSGLLVLGVTD